MNKMAGMPLNRQNRLIHESLGASPLGRVTLVGFLHDSPGAGQDRMRVFGSYALVYLLAGAGAYSDANGLSRQVAAGDAILVFPDVPHRYGPPLPLSQRGRDQPRHAQRDRQRLNPSRREAPLPAIGRARTDALHSTPSLRNTRAGRPYWDEIYLVFDGIVFDQLRAAGLLDPRRPVFHLGVPDLWLPRILEIADPALSDLPGQPLHRVSRLISLLAAALLDIAPFPDTCVDTPRRHAVGDKAPGRKTPRHEAAGQDAAPHENKTWLARAMTLLRQLDSDNRPLALESVAAALGLTYTAFRKRFTRQSGVAPARWRAALVIERAKQCLRDPDATLFKIAIELGFADEFHLSRRFKQIAGINPREYRRLLITSR